MGEMMILRRALATAFLTTVVSTAANAATFTWDAGGGSTDSWSTAANWVGNVAPSAVTDDVVIPFFQNKDSLILAPFSVNSVRSDMQLRIYKNSTDYDGSLNVNSDSSTTNFWQMQSAVLSGAGNFTISGASKFEGNIVYHWYPLQTGTGRTINNGTLQVGYGLYLDGGRSLVNNGSLTFGAGFVDLNGGGVSNAPGGGQIDNFGTVVFNTSSISPVSIVISNPTESGLTTLVHNESAGLMEHRWTGLVTIDTPFVNDGTFHLGAPSKFAFNGSFAQGAGGVFDIDVASSNTDWSKGNRTFADATLGGTLRLDATNLYAPKVGDTYTLFKATNHQGAFSSVTGGTGFDGMRVETSWAGTSFIATVAAVPEPESYAMLLAGLALMGGIARRRKLINS